MPKAELGSVKQLNNKLKSKGLQRLRWYCQVCEKQCRDENGFKMHVQSESHTRKMLIVGENSKKFIEDFSNQFKSDFLKLLRTGHGEKKTNLNRFYQEYIANKEHVHMNSTRWPSLTEFAKYLGRERICRVEEDENGIHISWIDNSPENLRRQDAVRKKERQDRGGEEREQALIKAQVKRALLDAEQRGVEFEDASGELKRDEGERIKLSFGAKAVAPKIEPATTPIEDGTQELVAVSVIEVADTAVKTEGTVTPDPVAPAKVAMKMGGIVKKPNVFAVKKNALGGQKMAKIEQPKIISEAERIMKMELEQKERKRCASAFSGPPQKKSRY
ncbi:domain of Kin17 curved DNA-binding protein-domain-containing protein [Calycina marina]|uniref:Domain of Kin17 curved DNA-binding protein-domain-containing protein n=1 Tax=Calycina marina TaxID=1763456 RepID=A0A9P7YVG6_9HELO|nr:domain of Kin17 curved DNA-binding protein-domain-containing protein [Calycina marina]